MDARKHAKSNTNITKDEKVMMLELARYGIPVAQIARLVDRSNTPVYALFRRLGVAVKPADRTPAQIATAIASLNTPAPAPVSQPGPEPPAEKPSEVTRSYPYGALSTRGKRTYTDSPSGVVGHLKRAARAMGAHIVTPRGATPEDMTALVLDLRRRIEAILVVLGEAEAKITDRS